MGSRDKTGLGVDDGNDDGDVLGDVVGVIDGVTLGVDDGDALGARVGELLGPDGFEVLGMAVGLLVGLLEGRNVGIEVGGSEGGSTPTSKHMYLLNFLASSVPRPVTGSQPTAALYPCTQQAGVDVQLFFPNVTSVVYAAGLL